jgi:ribonucleoside-diphosphate reductase beta chain
MLAFVAVESRIVLFGLRFSIELVSCDMGMHMDFACLMYSKLVNKLPESRVRAIVRDAVAIEHDFVCDSWRLS